MKSKASRYQPDPKPGSLVVLGYVIADVQERAESGKEKYGTYLEAYNGRDPLWDAYQEAIDLVMYLRQAILERDNEPACIEKCAWTRQPKRHGQWEHWQTGCGNAFTLTDGTPAENDMIFCPHCGRQLEVKNV